MAKLTKEEAILRTMTLWTELARTGEPLKRPAFNKLWPGETAVNLCWACEYTAQQDIDNFWVAFSCEYCPVWTHGLRCNDAEYRDWLCAANAAKRARSAQKIVERCQQALEKLNNEPGK